MESNRLKILSKFAIKAIPFPVFIFKDKEGFFVARNLLLNISTQARSTEQVKERIKEATKQYLRAFPEDITSLEEINMESIAYTNIELSPDDVEIAKTVTRGEAG